MILLGLEEFKTKRRSTQERIEEALRPLVRRALDTQTDTSGWSELLDEVAAQWRAVYAEESGKSGPGMSATFRQELRDVLQHTKRAEATDATEDRIVTWLATAVLSQATLVASDDDSEELFVEWVTMQDKAVRKTHAHTQGQVRPIGEKFTVGESKMRFPGDPRAQIEEWINCRCTLRPVLASEFSLVASIAHGTVAFRDVSTEERKKDADAGRALPDGSFPIDNCSDLRNAIQAIGRAKDPAKAKAHIRKRKSALGCPDVELPETWSLTAASDDPSDPTHAGIALQAADSGRVLMLQRKWDETDEPDVRGTWEFPGGKIEEGENAETAAWREFCEETGLPQPEGETTNGWISDDGVYQGFLFTVPVEEDAFEEINPNEVATPDPDNPERRHPDICAWFTVEQVMSLGPALRPEVAAMDWSIFGQSDEEETMTATTHEAASAPPEIDDELEAPEVTDDEDGPERLAPEQVRVPWHGVIAPEGKWSGDKRRFAEGSMRTRPLPTPITWQKTSADGHDGNVTVATNERMTRKDGEVRGSGYMLMTAEADELIGLLTEFGRFGISVDADDVAFELGDEEEGVTFTDSRHASACVVAIPAFAEAWISLGEPPEDFHGDDLAVIGPNDERESLVASIFGGGRDEKWGSMPLGLEMADVAPGRTEDGPGWLTHPVDTDRLRDYWVRGPGAAKIGWGTPGDFNRCRVNVAEYVKPQHLNGYCANRHFDALGFWPGPSAHGGEAITLTTDFGLETAQALSLVASAGHCAPSEWFEDPQFTKVTPMKITPDGEVFGHIADWTSCHTQFLDTCVLAPHSQTNYAYFRLGAVLTDKGEVPTGSLTIGGGHAGPNLSMRAAIEHYDDASTVWADVACGEDKHGIWVHGWVRPGTTPEMIHAARAAPPSGDWRWCAATNDLEMIGAHGIVSPGYAIPRIAAGMSGTKQLSLVAAGAVVPEEQAGSALIDVAALAAAVEKHIADREARKTRMAELSAAVETVINGEVEEAS